MAVAYDNSGETRILTPDTSISFNLTIGSGSNRAIVVALCFDSNAVSGVSVTVGGVSASLVSGTDSGTDTNARTMLFGLANPASGSQSISASWTTSTNAIMGAISVTGADQTTPLNNGSVAFDPVPAIAPTITITSNSGDLTIAHYADDNTAASGGTQTVRWTDNTFNRSASASTGPGTGTTTHEWTKDSGWSISGANFKAAAAGGSTSTGMGLLTVGIGR